MRNFQTLDQIYFDEQAQVIHLTATEGGQLNPRLALRVEGEHVALSASCGPIEIALRPRTLELRRLLKQVQPSESLLSARNVGTVQAYLAIALRPDGRLVLRPTIIADAYGHLCFNVELTNPVRERLIELLG
jgi:hypothetical protein